jgi:MoxR-like ATPase
VDYPSYEEELAIAETTTRPVTEVVEPVLERAEILGLQELVRRVPAAQHVLRYALELVRRTRAHEDGAPEFVKRMVTWGAGPRAVQFLVLGGKARAILRGGDHASTEDVKAIAHPVLRHRVITNYSAEAEGFTTDRITDELLASIDPQHSELSDDERIRRVLTS